MKEGASNSLERYLNLNGCDTTLIWTYSQVGNIRCGRGVSVVFIATYYSARYAYAALSAFVYYAAAKKSHNCVQATS